MEIHLCFDLLVFFWQKSVVSSEFVSKWVLMSIFFDQITTTYDSLIQLIW